MGEEAMEGGVKEEGGKDAFEPCSSFKGARPGYCFKMGVRGLGYYRDKYQDIKSDKKEEKKDVKDEKQEKASGDVKGEKKEKVPGDVKDEKKEKVPGEVKSEKTAKK